MKRFILLLSLPLTAALVSAQPCEPGSAEALLDGNNVAAAVYNNGLLFWNGQGQTYRVPKDGPANAIFNASLWISGLVDGEPRIAATVRGPGEFFPGPVSPENTSTAECEQYDRIYRVTQADIADYERTGIMAPDLAEWPAELGAPVLDGDDIPNNYDLDAGDQPALVGDQIVWWIMNDAAGVHASTSSPPLNVEVRVTATAVSRASVAQAMPGTVQLQQALDHTTFFRYQIRYLGDRPLEDARIAIYADLDLGDPGDDYFGSDTTLGLGFAYNADNFDDGETGYGDRPPAVGLDFVEGLHAASDQIDNDGDGTVDEPGERMPMTLFVSLTSGPTPMSSPHYMTEYFRLVHGRWKDESPVTYGDIGYGGDAPTSFMFPGMPPAYWSEENIDDSGLRNTPSDRRTLLAMGPVVVQPGEEQEFTVAVVWAQGNDRLDSVNLLKANDRLVQTFVDQGGLQPDERWLSLARKGDDGPPENPRSGLAQNLPNPFAGVTTIPFELAERGPVRISVYDVLGRELDVLIDGERSAGTHEVRFNASALSPGIYFFRMETQASTVTRPMVVLE